MAGLLSRLFGRMAPEPEQRRRGPLFADFTTGPLFGAGGGLVSARLAENISMVQACIGAIAGPISSVPARVYRAIPNGREEAPDHPVARLIRAPNARQSWPDWVSFMLGQVLLHGNALSLIERDADGQPTALIPVPWQLTQCQLLTSGRLAFDVTTTTLPWNTGGGPMRRLFEDEMIWLKDRSDDGYLGRSVLARAPLVLRQALGIQEYATGIWDRAAIPSGFLTASKSLSPEAALRLGTSFSEHYSGAKNSGKTIVLEEGLKFEQAAMSPEDAEVLASRRFTGEEICRLFSVPPPIAGDFQFGSFTNAETAGRWHSSLCLANWCRRIEAEFGRSVFGSDSDFHLMLDLSGLQRGDDAARWATYGIAIDKGILTVDEVRALEGFNPMPVAPGAAGGEVVPGSETEA